MKYLRFFLIVAISVCLLMGCSTQKDQEDVEYTPEQSVSGGVSSPAENINLKDIDITMDGDQTIITLSMLSGSRKAGYAESKLVKLPEYEIIQLEQPQRLVIKLENMSYWDYEQKTTWALSDFVLGVFREVPGDDDSLIVYVQLSKDADFSVEEAEGDLIIRLMPGSDNESAKYFCVSNAFFEHQEGTWPDNIEMMPVLCSDSENKMLISKPFNTKEQALAFMEVANKTIEQTLFAKTLHVIDLAKNSLPDYETGTDYSQADKKSVVMRQGVLIDTPVILQNGKYLATTADGRIAFSRRYKPEEPALEQDVYNFSEKLWILEPNGRIQNIEVSEFFSIDEAAFSVDGRYLCILDVSIENRVLYIYDFKTEELINLGEEGFGSQTAAFAWSDQGNMLYAMTGYGSMQMMSCEFLSDGSIYIEAVEEQAGAEGKLGVSQGRLFFADNFAGQAGKIYEIGESRREITDGVDFCISPDGKTMLVLEAASHEGEVVLTSLKLCDIETGAEKYITKNADIISFSYSQNGGKVYFTDMMIDDVVEGYDYGLYTYDIISGVPAERVALCSNGEFSLAATSGEIYFVEYIDDIDTGFNATYVYDLSL